MGRPNSKCPCAILRQSFDERRTSFPTFSTCPCPFRPHRPPRVRPASRLHASDSKPGKPATLQSVSKTLENLSHVAIGSCRPAAERARMREPMKEPTPGFSEGLVSSRPVWSSAPESVHCRPGARSPTGRSSLQPDRKEARRMFAASCIRSSLRSSSRPAHSSRPRSRPSSAHCRTTSGLRVRRSLRQQAPHYCNSRCSTRHRSRPCRCSDSSCRRDGVDARDDGRSPGRRHPGRTNRRSRIANSTAGSSSNR